MKRLAVITLSAATLGLTLASGANAFKPLGFSELTRSTMTQEAVHIAAAPGEFVTVEQDHPTTGTARIETRGDDTYLVFDDAFTTATGPDVQVVLYTGDQAPVNLPEGSYVEVAALQGFDGSQEYLIDSSINLDDYETVAIWCREFNVTFGYAPL
jgi:hypothetical protein